MGVTILLALASLLLAFSLAERILGTRHPLESLCIAPNLGACLLILGANFLGPVHGRLSMLGAFAILAILIWLVTKGEPPHPSVSENCPDTHDPRASNPLPSRRALFFTALPVLSLIGFYVLYAQFRFLDSDNWIHEPLIAGYALSQFPPVHPFFPEISMNGHYGRDLLIGTLLPHGNDPLQVVWFLNPLLAVASAGLLYAIFIRWGDRPGAAMLATLFAFFGMCVGFRVGLADSADGNNGVAYAVLILLFWLMLRVLEILKTASTRPPIGLWLTAGIVLGVYQLIYETHFGLMLLTAAIMFPVAWGTQKPRRNLLLGTLITAVLGVGLAAVEGGPITDLVNSHRLGAAAPKGTADDLVSDLNVGQHVSIAFPKEELFKVRATTALYQRLSVAFTTKPFTNLAPPVRGEGFLSIFSVQFLITHWLPLFLSPFTLAWCLRRRHYPALAFWVFGAWAYLVPGLFDFGPVYEWEYFRWEFAAGFGFAVPLGLWIASLLEPPKGAPPVWALDRDEMLRLRFDFRHFPVFFGLLLLVAGLLPGQKLVNRAIIDLQKNGAPGPISPSTWRIERSELGLRPVDIEASRALASLILPGETVMTNLGDETPFGLWPDCGVATLTGARISGRARPPVDRRVHAHPNYHRSAIFKALELSERLDLLWLSKTDWLFFDPNKSELPELLKGSPQARLVLEANSDEDHRQLWYLRVPPALGPDLLPATPPFRHRLVHVTDNGPASVADSSPGEWRSGTAYPLQLTVANPQEQEARLGWLRLRLEDPRGVVHQEPLHYLLGEGFLSPEAGDIQSIAFVTPLEEGLYDYVGELLTEDGPQELFRFPIEISLVARLSALEGNLEVPDAVKPKSMVDLKLDLHSPSPLVSWGELELLTRYRHPGGDYVWELDRLSNPLNLDLPEGGTETLEWKVLAPWEEGIYELEFEILDKRTGSRTPLTVPVSKLIVISS